MICQNVPIHARSLPNSPGPVVKMPTQAIAPPEPPPIPPSPEPPFPPTPEPPIPQPPFPEPGQPPLPEPPIPPQPEPPIPPLPPPSIPQAYLLDSSVFSFSDSPYHHLSMK
jgi:hypothetical protein